MIAPLKNTGDAGPKSSKSLNLARQRVCYPPEEGIGAGSHRSVALIEAPRIKFKNPQPSNTEDWGTQQLKIIQRRGHSSSIVGCDVTEWEAFVEASEAELRHKLGHPRTYLPVGIG
jgi:hypothetical protein